MSSTQTAVMPLLAHQASIWRRADVALSMAGRWPQGVSESVLLGSLSCAATIPEIRC